jgi:hypothetical protein
MHRSDVTGAVAGSGYRSARSVPVGRPGPAFSTVLSKHQVRGLGGPNSLL